MSKTKTCRRGHKKTKANTKVQVNSYRREDGTKSRYTTEVCKICASYRARRRSQGAAVRDMRRGRR